MNKRKIILLGLSIALTLTIVALLSYAYFNGTYDLNATINTTLVFADNYKLSTSGNTTLSGTVEASEMFRKENDETVFTATGNIDVILEKTDDKARICNYDILWEWDDTLDDYTISEEGILEYTIKTSTLEEKNLPNYDADSFVLYSESIRIEVSETSTTKTYDFSLQFYNLANVDQSVHLGKSYNGNLKIDNVKCSEVPLADTIIALAENRDSTNNTWQVINENGYRYEGNSTTENNLCLDATCSVPYKIIGVFETPYDADGDGTIEDGEKDYLVKVVRTTQQTTTQAWNTTSSNNWTTATLQTSLNATSGTDEVNVYANMSDAVKNKIAKARWYLGNVTYNTTSATMYSAERSATVHSGNSEYYDNYIGLIYPSDYGYAPLASSCRSYTLDKYYDYAECDEQNWLFTSGKTYWTVSPSSISSSIAMYVYSTGSVNSYGVSNAHGVRESFYLVPSASASGDGSTENPYVLAS